MPAVMLRDLFHMPEFDDFPGPFAGRAGHVARGLRQRWNQTSREAVESRKVPDLHATRDDYRALLDGHLRLIEQYLAVAELHQDIFGPDAARVEELRRAAGELRQLRDELFPRWQSVDDLYAILIEKFTPSEEEFQALTAKYPPPPSWYDETDDPFSAD